MNFDFTNTLYLPKEKISDNFDNKPYKCRFLFSSGNYYDGEIMNGKYHGKGVYGYFNHNLKINQQFF